MADDLISGNSLLRAAATVRAQREAERAAAIKGAAATSPVRTTSQVRAALNVIPDDESLTAMIGRALTALSRGIRWARGSIVNLIV